MNPPLPTITAAFSINFCDLKKEGGGKMRETKAQDRGQGALAVTYFRRFLQSHPSGRTEKELNKGLVSFSEEETEAEE
jgi:hypothetical protein